MTSQDSARHVELVKELQKYDKGNRFGIHIHKFFATFILEDRRRIVEPLVRARSFSSKVCNVINEFNILSYAVDEALRNAGID